MTTIPNSIFLIWTAFARKKPRHSERWIVKHCMLCKLKEVVYEIATTVAEDSKNSP